MTPSPGCTMTARRLLFVFHWLVVGGEETEVRLLARHLRPDWSVLPCFAGSCRSAAGR